MVNDLYIECPTGWWAAGRAKERESSRDALQGRSDGVKGVAHGECTLRAHRHNIIAAATAHDDWQVEPSGGRLPVDVD